MLTVVAAQNAAHGGNWQAALPLYEQAIRDRQPDGLRLRVERLFGFFAVSDEKTLIAELDALGAGPISAIFPPSSGWREGRTPSAIPIVRRKGDPG